MHQTRNLASKKLPIPRKGTKYVARASGFIEKSVPVVIAVRDMLKLAKNAKEVKQMINNNEIKINGRAVKDLRESISLFNILEAGKKYRLSILETGRFYFEEYSGEKRICKIVGKGMFKKGKIQLRLHDGTTIISDKKIQVGDSIVIDFSGKILEVLDLKKGREAFVSSGKSIGKTGTIQEIHDRRIRIKFKDSERELEKSGVVAI